MPSHLFGTPNKATHLTMLAWQTAEPATINIKHLSERHRALLLEAGHCLKRAELACLVLQLSNRCPLFDTAIVNLYLPGDGIAPHVDLLRFAVSQPFMI